MSGFKPAEDLGDLIRRYSDRVLTPTGPFIDTTEKVGQQNTIQKRFAYGDQLGIDDILLVTGSDVSESLKRQRLFVVAGPPIVPMRFMNQSEEIRTAIVSLRLYWKNYGKGRDLITAIMDFLLGRDIWVQTELTDETNPFRSFISKAVAGVAGTAVPIKYLDVNATISEPTHPGKFIEQLEVLSCTFRMVYPQASTVPPVVAGEPGYVTTSAIEGEGVRVIP